MMFIHEIEQFIKEDIGYNDVSCTILPDIPVKAEIIVKEDCVLAGLDVAKSIFDYFKIIFNTKYTNGSHVSNGSVIFNLEGSGISILRAERIVLNFIGHLSGIATITKKCVERANAISSVIISCTRKTTPGLRKFEKMAVIAGGGDSHRFNLSDMIMIKDNHISVMGLKNAIQFAKLQASYTQKIEVEVKSSEDAVIAANLGADIIMLDNMAPTEIINTIELLKKENCRNSVIVEASGGIDFKNLEEYAKTGVDVISMGSLIRKSNWIDVSLNI